MILERKVRLKNDDYIVVVDLEYRNIKGFPHLCLKNYDYGFDCGNFSLLLSKIAKNYSDEEFYDKKILMMNRMLYIYNRVPFLSAIKNVSSNDILYISKIEIEQYINDFNIKMLDNSRFNLEMENTWLI